MARRTWSHKRRNSTARRSVRWNASSCILVSNLGRSLPFENSFSDDGPIGVRLTPNFSGQVPTTAIGSDAFQEADILGITRSCTKWNVLVKNVAEIPLRIDQAFEIAVSGRPGPVLVDIPNNIQAAILREPIPMTNTLPARHSATRIAIRGIAHNQLRETIQRAAKLINIAKKPIIYAGQGILAFPEGPKLLKELADKACIPVTTTILGLGGFDELDEKSLHFLGMHGAAYANLAMQEADVIIALGSRFDDRVTGESSVLCCICVKLTLIGNIAKFAPQAKAAEAEKRGGVIHFEIMPKNINKIVQATEAVEGDVTTNLALLLPYVRDTPSRPEWFGQINNWKKTFPFAYERKTPDELIKPRCVIKNLSNLTADVKDRSESSPGRFLLFSILCLNPIKGVWDT